MWRRMVYWQGAYGYSRLLITSYSAQPATLPGYLDNAVLGYSNAYIAQIAEGLVTVVGGVAVVQTYPSVTQLARIVCLDSLNLEFTLGVPAPILALFEADGITVTPTALSTLLSAAASDGLVNPATGSPVTAMISGTLNGPAKPGLQLTGV
jgi:hypothetical protein